MGNIVAIDRLARTIIRAALIRARKTIRIQPFWICAVVWGGTQWECTIGVGWGGGDSVPGSKSPSPGSQSPPPGLPFFGPLGPSGGQVRIPHNKTIRQDPKRMRYPHDLDPRYYGSPDMGAQG